MPDCGGRYCEDGAHDPQCPAFDEPAPKPVHVLAPATWTRVKEVFDLRSDHDDEEPWTATEEP